MANGHGGKRPGSGRRKGQTPKLTQDLKRYILETALRLEDDGRGLCAWALENPSLFWTQMFKGILPKPIEVTGKDGGDIGVKVTGNLNLLGLLDAIDRNKPKPD